jgi:hypothetical protein
VLRLTDDKTISYWDIKRTPGRDDPPHLIDTCWRYLDERTTGENRIPTSDPQSDRKIRSEIATAHLQAGFGSRGAITSLQKRLADAETTIDRLLAFVPTRARDLATQRLNEITKHLLDRAAQLFPDSNRTFVQIQEESDPDTPACHRLQLSIDVDVSKDPTTFAHGVTSLHRALVEVTTPQELSSLRLLVEPLE